MAVVCPSCGSLFPDGTTVCDTDGDELVAAPNEYAHTMAAEATAGGGPATVPTGPARTRSMREPTGPIDVAPLELVAGTVVGEYVVEKQIGEGGMGLIFAARHPLIGKRVALKVLNSDLASHASMVQRFIQEARSVNEIGHPNLIDIFSFGRLPDGRHYFVMELLDGRPFSKVVRDLIGWEEAMAIWRQVCAAVEAAHARGIVHRDLKPDNIFVTPRADGPFVKVLDFGIAKLMGDNSNVLKTSTGIPIGTPAYMSPEQTRGDSIDHRTDIYALGCIFYETVTGQPPFDGSSFLEVMNKQLGSPPPPFDERRQVDEGMQALIFACLEKDPARRPASVAAVNERLSGLREAALKSGRALFRRDGLAPVRNSPSPATRREEITALEVPARGPAAPAAAPMPAPAPSPATTPPAKRGRALFLGAGLAGFAVIVAVAATRLGGARSPAPAPAPMVVVAPPAAAPSTGRIKILGLASGATLFLDGEKIFDAGPLLSLEAAPGPHALKVTRNGFLPFSTELVVTAGQTTEAQVHFEPEPTAPSAPTPPPRSPGAHKKPVARPTIAVPHAPTLTDKNGMIDPFR